MEQLRVEPTSRQITAHQKLSVSQLLGRADVERSGQIDVTARRTEVRTQVFHAGGLAPWQLRLVKDHVSANLGGALRNAELARLVRLSASHFSRAFNTSAGISPHVFVVRARMDEAKRLMRESARALCEIALICGFADQAHLSRSFRRCEGVSPGAWRRQSAKNSI